MRSENQSPIANDFIKLHNKDYLNNLRVAGSCVSSIMSQLISLVKEKSNFSLLEYSKFAEYLIIKSECVPTFKGYKGFPEAVCISVNRQLVHGIPTDYKLEDGDIVSFDFGATYKGSVADSAVTLIYGTPKSSNHIKLVESCQEALYKGMKAIKVGSRLGVIGNAIHKSAKNNGFEVVTAYGGHSCELGPDGKGCPHAPPFVSNKANPDEGVRIQPGLMLAVEPLLTLGSTETRISKDQWTVTTDSLSAHFEHSLFVHEDHVEIVTLRKEEVFV